MCCWPIYLLFPFISLEDEDEGKEVEKEKGGREEGAPTPVVLFQLCLNLWPIVL